MSCSASPTQRARLHRVVRLAEDEHSPSVMRMRLQTALIRVVLPAPFGPSRPKNAPPGSRGRSPRPRACRRRSAWSGHAARAPGCRHGTPVTKLVTAQPSARPYCARSTRGTRRSGSAPTTPRCRGTTRPSARGPSSKCICGLPAERAHLVRGQRVAAVVAGPVGHVLDQRLVPPGQLQDPAGPRRCSRTRRARPRCTPRPAGRARARVDAARRSPRRRASCAPGARRRTPAADRRGAR